MTVERPYRDWPPSALAEELASFENQRVDLIAALETEQDVEVRVQHLAELTTVTDVLDQLTAEVAERNIPPSRPPTRRSVVVPEDHQPASDNPPLPYQAEDYQRSDRASAGPNVSQPRRSTKPAGRRRLGMVVAAAILIAVGTGAYLLLRPESESAEEVASQPAGAEQEDSIVTEIQAVVGAVGGPDILVERRGSTIFLSGTVSSAELQRAIINSAAALAGDVAVDSSALTVSEPTTVAPSDSPASGRESTALQSEIDRIVAATPIIFGKGETELSELQQRVLNNVAATMTAYPGVAVSVIGYTDDLGSDESNRQLSLARAENVRDYLIGRGLAESLFSIEAMGEEESTGSEQLANLERRVELKVAPGVPADATPLRIAMVAPSDREDLAFTQSMVDAIDTLAIERGSLEVAITDNAFVPDEAGTALRAYADQGYDLIIAHGSQYGPLVLELAPEYSDVAFAWGTASDTFDLPNVYAYEAAAEEGGYVLGALSALLSETGTIGVIGPIEIGDAEQYVNGFRAGALSESPTTSVRVVYTGSFSDTALAKEAAEGHVAAGADVLTGSAQMVLGAVAVVIENDLLWFGNQADQVPLAPDDVGASQVYHWEVILRQIVAAVSDGTTLGQSYTANLANGGLIIEYNSAVPLPESVRQRADELVAGIVSGAITVDG